LRAQKYDIFPYRQEKICKKMKFFYF